MPLRDSQLATQSLSTTSTPAPSGLRAVSDVVPRNVVDAERLTYHLLRPQQSGPADIPVLGEAYRCWSEVWTQTFAELDGAKQLASDDFTRQDEIGALFHDWECIGMTFFRWVDLANPIFKEDSYFAAWSPSAFAAATSRGTRVCISSHFTIAGGWRSAKGCSVKYVLGALIIERFLRSDCDAMVGTMRNDRGMNKFTYRLGAHALERNAIHHGVEVDLIGFYRQACIRPKLADDVESVIARVLGEW
jgi:hypothetical protein